MNISPLTQKTFLDPFDRLPDHPLKPKMRDAIIAARAASEQFSGRKIALTSDRRRTELGQRQALQEALTQNHGKAWARAKAPVTKARAGITAQSDALVVKPANPANAMGDWEIRTWFNAKDIGAKLATALSTTDPEILHALLLKPELCGLKGLPPVIIDRRPVPVIDHIKERYKEMVYPTELAAIAADDAVVAEAEAACGMAYNEMRSTLDAVVVEVETTDGVTRHELLSVADNPRAFDDLMKPVEIIQPWLTSDKKQVIEIVDDKASYRVASADEIENGRLFSPEAYAADRAA
jgi:hypothetical protein